MKKRIKLFFMLSIVFVSTGCMKVEVSLGINKDKSMEVTMIEAIDMETMTQFGENTSIYPILDETQIEELESVPGVKVEEYKEDSLEGFKVTRKFSSIDEISSEKEIESNLSVITDMKELSDDSYVFQVKKGLFKNTYKAIFADVTKGMDSFTSGEEIPGLEGFDPSIFISQMDFNFSIRLPYGAIHNNATSVEDGGKKLIWDLMGFQEDDVEFEFVLYNTTAIYVTLGITVGFILILIVLVLITLRGNKKRRQKELSEHIETEQQPEIVLPIQDMNIQPQFYQSVPTVSPVELNPNMTSSTEINPNVQNINNDYYNNMQ